MNHRSWKRAGIRALLAAALLLGGGAVATAADDPSSSGGVVNINTATAAELELLPGIGPSKARAILAVRREKGGFESLDELEEVKGIGPMALERMRPFATTSGKTTARVE
ncbi:MAG: helix-hairpin-helix domain-containing protein [Myxococcota bacterium]